jgi:hypothetical protein
VCLIRVKKRPLPRCSWLFNMRGHLLLGGDMYTCIPARTYLAAEVSVGRSERKGDLQSLIGFSRDLTIGPDALKSLPEASPGHQEPPVRAKGGSEEHQNTPARCVCERMLMDARTSGDTHARGAKNGTTAEPEVATLPSLVGWGHVCEKNPARWGALSIERQFSRLPQQSQLESARPAAQHYSSSLCCSPQQIFNRLKRGRRKLVPLHQVL